MKLESDQGGHRRDRRSRLARNLRGLLVAVVVVSGALAETPCEKLKSLSLPQTTITAAESVPVAASLPAHCRIAAVLKPSDDSRIGIEVWLPDTNWNGKFDAVGNGAWAGVFSYAAMTSALEQGYATASTDTGHKERDGSFALGHPEKLIDFAYRAPHEMTVASKAIITAFYGRGPRLSYWDGCSTGGRQALMEAQRYPEDFDGIIAGDPAFDQTHIYAAAIELFRATSTAKLSPAKYALLNNAVLAACDALDGVKDGIVADPRQCHFDASTLLCKNGDAENCLTATQVDAVKTAYGPVVTKSGKVIAPRFELGNKLGWDILTGGEAPGTAAVDTFRYLTYQDPHWDWHSFDLERDTAEADRKGAAWMNAINPDLSAFKKHGGKLLIYHGWNDQLISPEFTVNYYRDVLERMGPKQDDWLRLFMVPGMLHCRGGPAPDHFNPIGALERWRESNQAPDRIVAAHVTDNRVDMTRPLCPFPQVAHWTGAGSTTDAANFVCKAP